MADYALVFAAIFALNLLPAFGPPTWSVLVLVSLNLDLEPWLLVSLGALAASCGRLTLAVVTRHFRDHFSAERIRNLDAARAALTRSRTRGRLGLGLFLLSPVPSAQLFVGAGLLGLRLLPLTLAFFCGRVVSYSIYVGAATAAAETNLGDIVRDSFTSPLGLALQLVMLGGLVALMRIDWVGRLGGQSPSEAEPPSSSAPDVRAVRPSSSVSTTG